MQTALPQIPLHGFTIANHRPFVLFGGMNVLESRDLAMEIAETYIEICRKLDIPYVFKASFDKANRSSLHSFRGPGLEKGLQWLADIKSAYNVPVITDIHEPLPSRTGGGGGRYFTAAGLFEPPNRLGACHGAHRRDYQREKGAIPRPARNAPHHQ